MIFLSDHSSECLVKGKVGVILCMYVELRCPWFCTILLTFCHSGRTEKQVLADSMSNRPAPQVVRTPSKRHQRRASTGAESLPDGESNASNAKILTVFCTSIDCQRCDFERKTLFVGVFHPFYWKWKTGQDPESSNFAEKNWWCDGGQGSCRVFSLSLEKSRLIIGDVNC